MQRVTGIAFLDRRVIFAAAVLLPALPPNCQWLPVRCGHAESA
jgi:hypothetical protein